MLKVAHFPTKDDDTPWTRLKGSYLWKVAKAIYGHNGLAYHNFDHVRRLYAWAAALNLPYSAALDMAILFHDVIFDGKGRHEMRSIEFFSAVSGQPAGSVGTYIEATIEHDPRHQGALLALLDLADFLMDARTDANSALLRKEAKKMRGKDFDERTQRKNNAKYLIHLEKRIAYALKAEPPHADIWEGIRVGIQRTISRLQETPSTLVGA